MSTGTAVSFSTKASNREGGNYEKPPVGAHPAVLVAIVDLGTTKSTYNGKEKDRHKIMLVWELTAENNSKGENFLVGQDYTWSLAKNAALRPIVEGFRGTDLADNEEYDIGSMLGQPCQITLGTDPGGYIVVKGVCKPMRGVTVPPASRETYVFHWGAVSSAKDDFGIPEWMPWNYGRKVEDDLKACQEYAALPPF